MVHARDVGTYEDGHKPWLEARVARLVFLNVKEGIGHTTTPTALGQWTCWSCIHRPSPRCTATSMLQMILGRIVHREPGLKHVEVAEGLECMKHRQSRLAYWSSERVVRPPQPTSGYTTRKCARASAVLVERKPQEIDVWGRVGPTMTTTGSHRLGPARGPQHADGPSWLKDKSTPNKREANRPGLTTRVWLRSK